MPRIQGRVDICSAQNYVTITHFWVFRISQQYRRMTASRKGVFSINIVCRGAEMVRTLRQWRANRLLSIRDLADVAGVTPKTLTDIEYGRRRPTYDTMRTISKALGVSPHDIQEFLIAMESRGQRSPAVEARDGAK